MTTVLVTGATGNVGSQVVRELRGRGVAVRAFVRDPDKATAMLGQEVELAKGDFSDPYSIQAALEGVERVFLACGNVQGQVEYETNVIEAAATAGVKRIVKLSAVGAEIGSPLAFWDWQGRLERHLRGSGMPAVILRPTTYMTNLLGRLTSGARPILTTVAVRYGRGAAASADHAAPPWSVAFWTAPALSAVVVPLPFSRNCPHRVANPPSGAYIS